MPIAMITAEGRALFHAIYEEWMVCEATDGDLEQLLATREEVPRGVPCSMLTLVRACFAEPQTLSKLPASLVTMLCERHWPQIAAFAVSA
jgi:hypothetical protein